MPTSPFAGTYDQETQVSRLHVCHVASALKGGSEIMVSQLVTAQCIAGHRVSVVYSPVRDRLEDFRHLFPESVEFIPWEVGREISVSRDYRAYGEIRKILGSLHPAIVHLHNAKAGALGRIACRRLGIPCIYTPHGLPFLRRDSSWWKRKLHFLVEWILSLFGGHLVALSPSEYRSVRWMPCATSVIFNGVDVSAIQALASSAVVDRVDRRFRIVLSGRVETPKNPKGVAEIAARCPSDWEWIWIGDGSLRHFLDEGGRFAVTGWVPREKALALVKSADVFLQASLWEGMSFALLEAMALGRICVVSNAVGNRDLIEDRVTGFVCDNTETYATVLRRVAADSDSAVRMGEAAQQHVAEHCDLNVLLSRWAELYVDVLAQNNANRRFDLRGIANKSAPARPT